MKIKDFGDSNIVGQKIQPPGMIKRMVIRSGNPSGDDNVLLWLMDAADYARKNGPVIPFVMNKQEFLNMEVHV